MQRRSQMQFKRAAAALLAGAAAVGLLGCNSNVEPPAPKVSQTPASTTRPAEVPDTTPKAGDVFKTGAPPAQTSTNAQRTDPAHELTKQEESTAMPMPGQANDHSTLAKDPAKR